MARTQEQLGAGYELGKEAGLADIWFAPTGGRYTFKTTGEQTAGGLLQVLCGEPRGAAPPLHVHHDTDETWYVLEGHVTVFVGDERFDSGPGDFVLGPRGVPHTFLVTSERAEFLASFAPAAGAGPAGAGLEGFFGEIGIPVVPGEGPPDPAPPDPGNFARRAAEYGIEIIGPPPILH